LDGWKCDPPPDTVESQSNQYVPAGSVVFIETVFFQIFLVVPGVVPGGGTAELKMR
jgi:hypothetical protein